MPFPITANGTTYNLSDFQNGGYARKLGPFLSDLMTDGHAFQRCTSNTSNSMTAGSKTFTVNESSAEFYVGQQLLVVLTANPLAWMSGMVTGWNSGTHVVTVSITVTNLGSGTASDWQLYTGQRGLAPSGTLSLDNGGTGVTTSIAARDSLGMAAPGASAKPVFHDFIGYKRAVSNQASTNAAETGYRTYCKNGGTINPEYHKSDKAYIVLPSMGEHPGVMELTVRNGGDVAAYAMSDYGQYAFGYHELIKLSFCIFIPPYTNDKLSPGGALPETDDIFTDQWTFRLGWLKNWRITASGSFDSAMGNTGSIDEFGCTVGNSQNVKNPGVMYFESSTSATVFDSELGSQLSLPVGRWLTITMATDDTSTVTITVLDETGTVLEQETFAQSNGELDANAGIPFIRLYKHTGNRPRSLYIDYVHVEHPSMFNR